MFTILLYKNTLMMYIKVMDRNEKATVTVRIYDSTSKTINKWRGNSPAGLFIDTAVAYYVKSLDSGDVLNKMQKDIEDMKHCQRTNLGLLCEVLKQVGVLDGNGEIQVPSKD